MGSSRLAARRGGRGRVTGLSGRATHHLPSATPTRVVLQTREGRCEIPREVHVLLPVARTLPYQLGRFFPPGCVTPSHHSPAAPPPTALKESSPVTFTR